MSTQKRKKEIEAIVRQRKLEYMSFRRWDILSACTKDFNRAIKDELYHLDKGWKLDERDEKLLRALEKLLSQVQAITDEGYAAYSKPHEGRHWSFSHLC